MPCDCSTQHIYCFIFVDGCEEADCSECQEDSFSTRPSSVDHSTMIFVVRSTRVKVKDAKISYHWNLDVELLFLTSLDDFHPDVTR